MSVYLIGNENGIKLVQTGHVVLKWKAILEKLEKDGRKKISKDKMRHM